MITFTLTRAFETRVEATERVQDCAAMFGIGVDESIRIDLYRDLQVHLSGGRVIYITGESGAGKSCLLGDIRAGAEAHAEIRLVPTPDVKAVPDKPLVDQFGDWTIKRVCELLNSVGITEAFIYLRKPRELSDGQRYRFLLALMIADAIRARDSGDARIPLVTLDEYLAFLDRDTARNVAYQTRRAATAHGLCFAVATTHRDIQLDLNPNFTVILCLNQAPVSQQTALAGA